MVLIGCLLFLGKDEIVFINEEDEREPVKDIGLSNDVDVEEMGNYP